MLSEQNVKIFNLDNVNVKTESLNSNPRLHGWGYQVVEMAAETEAQP